MKSSRHLSKLVGGGYRGWVEIPMPPNEHARFIDGPTRRLKLVARLDAWRIQRSAA